MLFGKPAQSDAQKEEERKAIERAMASVRDLLMQLRSASPAEAERLHDRVKAACTDKRLPLEFKTKSMGEARTLECHANMRATDAILRQAIRFASGEQMKERAATLADARKYFGKACALGADEEFRRAAQRLIETIMMTGGVHRPGPTRAKPLDMAPKAPNRAKPEDTTPKGPNRAKF